MTSKQWRFVVKFMWHVIYLLNRSGWAPNRDGPSWNFEAELLEEAERLRISEDDL